MNTDERLRKELIDLFEGDHPQDVAVRLGERGYFVTFVGLPIFRPLDDLLVKVFKSVGAETCIAVSLLPQSDQVFDQWIIPDVPIEVFAYEGLEPLLINLMLRFCVVSPDLSAGLYAFDGDVGILFLAPERAKFPNGFGKSQIIDKSEQSLVNAWSGESELAKRAQKSLNDLFWEVRELVDG